jgi:branched-chain amino acid transport system permease protein
MMSQLLLSVISGIASGSVYGLMGLGLVIIYRSTDVVNFALASMALTAMYIAVSVQQAGLAVLLALLIGVLAASIGAVVAREVVIRPLGQGRLFSALVVTMGLSLIIDQVTQQIWGGEPRSFPPLIGGRVHIGGAAFENQQLLTIGVAALAMLAVGYLFRRTPLGSVMRAVAESSDTAAILGVRPQRVARVAWALGLALAAIGAGLAAPGLGLAIGVLQAPLFRAFAGIFLGGLTSMYGAVVGGLIIGVLDNLAASYVSASFRDTFVFTIAIAALLIRPQGLFGQRTFARV